MMTMTPSLVCPLKKARESLVQWEKLPGRTVFRHDLLFPAVPVGPTVRNSNPHPNYMQHFFQPLHSSVDSEVAQVVPPTRTATWFVHYKYSPAAFLPGDRGFIRGGGSNNAARGVSQQHETQSQT